MDEAERLSIIRLDGEPALRVAGELDAYTAPALEAALLGNGGDIPVRLDLSEVSFIDSTGIRVIVKADNELRERNLGLVIVAPSVSVLRLLELTSLDEHLEIEAAP